MSEEQRTKRAWVPGDARGWDQNDHGGRGRSFELPPSLALRVSVPVTLARSASEGSKFGGLYPLRDIQMTLTRSASEGALVAIRTPTRQPGPAATGVQSCGGWREQVNGQRSPEGGRSDPHCGASPWQQMLSGSAISISKIISAMLSEFVKI